MLRQIQCNNGGYSEGTLKGLGVRLRETKRLSGLLSLSRLLSRNSYTWAGLGLLIAGVLISVSAYFLFLLTWLTAMGVAMLILSFILLALSRTIPKLPPEVSGLLLETGIDNISSMVEELGIQAQAIYLPSSLSGGRPQALLPLHSNSSLPIITKALPRRLIVRYGVNPDEVGILLTTAGTTAVDMLEAIPAPDTAELESVLVALFNGVLGVADGAGVTGNESHIRVEIRNPRLEDKASWYHRCLGGTLASVVASLVAEAWDRPVTIRQEEQRGGSYLVELEVLE